MLFNELPSEEKHLAEGLEWAPTLPDAAGYWALGVKEVRVVRPGDSEEHQEVRQVLPNLSANRLALDTGSSLSMGPTADLGALLELIGPCHKKQGGLQKLPTLEFVLNSGKVLSLPPAAYAEENAETGCGIALHNIDLPPELKPMWILGQQFFRHYAAVFDIQNRRVGLGALQRRNVNVGAGGRSVNRVSGELSAKTTTAKAQTSETDQQHSTLAVYHPPGTTSSGSGGGATSSSSPLPQRNSRLLALEQNVFGLKLETAEHCMSTSSSAAAARSPSHSVEVQDEPSASARTSTECSHFASFGFCKRDLNVAHAFCARSCGMCGQKRQPVALTMRRTKELAGEENEGGGREMLLLSQSSYKNPAGRGRHEMLRTANKANRDFSSRSGSSMTMPTSSRSWASAFSSWWGGNGWVPGGLTGEPRNEIQL